MYRKVEVSKHLHLAVEQTKLSTDQWGEDVSCSPAVKPSVTPNANVSLCGTQATKMTSECHLSTDHPAAARLSSVIPNGCPAESRQNLSVCPRSASKWTQVSHISPESHWSPTPLQTLTRYNDSKLDVFVAAEMLSCAWWRVKVCAPAPRGYQRQEVCWWSGGTRGTAENQKSVVK